MAVDRNARRVIQRELGDLGTVAAYQATRQPGRRMTGWYAAVAGDPLDGCDCGRCVARRDGRSMIWLGPDRVDALYHSRTLSIRHARAAKATPVEVAA